MRSDSVKWLLLCSQIDADDVNFPLPAQSTVEQWGIPGTHDSGTHLFALLAFLKIGAARAETPAIRSPRCIAIPTAKV